MTHIGHIPTAADLLTRAKLSRDLIQDFSDARYDAVSWRKVCGDAMEIALDEWRYYNKQPGALLPRAAMDRAINELADWCFTQIEDREIVDPAFDAHCQRNDYRAAIAREERS
jgi:hypothetical protein